MIAAAAAAADNGALDGDAVLALFATQFVVLPHRRMDDVPIVRSYHDEQRRQRERAMVRATVLATFIMSDQHVPETIVDRVAEYIDDEWFEEDSINRINLSMSQVSPAIKLAELAPYLDVLLREMDQYRSSATIQQEVLFNTLRLVDWLIFEISDPNPAGRGGRTNHQVRILAKLHEIHQRALLCDGLLNVIAIHDYVDLLCSSQMILTLKVHDDESEVEVQNFANLLLQHETCFPDLVNFVLCQVIFSHGAYDLIAHSRLFRDGPQVGSRQGCVQFLMSKFVGRLRRREIAANEVVTAFRLHMVAAHVIPASDFVDNLMVFDPQTGKVVGVQAAMLMTFWRILR